MMNEILRKDYLEKLDEFREKKLIKVITGVRRCGKSVLLMQFQELLKKSGVLEEQIISLNFEKLELEKLLDYRELHSYISERLYENGYTYIFLDEIQMVENFQKAVNSLHTKNNVDIYITGSNSHLLSGELATYISGRYVQIHVMPLSFAEFYNYTKSKFDDKNAKDILIEYIKLGSFPQILELNSQNAIFDYLDSVFNTVVIKDICGREKSIDIGILTSLTKFVFHNIGSLISSTKIADTLTSNKRKTSYNTVEKYLGYLKDSFIIYEANRFDIKGKQHLKQNAKYYAVDSGLRNMLLSNKHTDIGHVLENIVYLELLRRGFKVSVGKVDVREVDFVAIDENGTTYYQVAASVLDQATFERELEPLNAINDHFPKFLITLDDFTFGTTQSGIKIINAIDFLLK